MNLRYSCLQEVKEDNFASVIALFQVADSRTADEVQPVIFKQIRILILALDRQHAQ
jgi:hypothetical protein